MTRISSEECATRLRAIPVLTGPTGVGKTALSLDLAEHIDAEILSADSRQIFRELTIGTAKPGAKELARIPHHFINERSLGEPFSAGIFAEEAEVRMRDIMRRGRVPLVVGGSTLYLQALLHGLADIPPVEPTVREQVEQRLRHEGAERLYRELQTIDPAAAATMDPTKTQRLVRALEVYYGTGQPISSYHETKKPRPFSFRTVVLYRDREELYRRIEQRVDEMLADGLLDEVRGLLERGADPGLNALQTIGYQEPIRFLRGEINYDEMVRLLKRNSRRYAKRQLTWFRRFPEYVWMDANSPDLAHRLIDFFCS